MNEYAISLYFDKQSNEKLLDLMHTAADACGNDYMLEPILMPPHITVCYFTADSISEALQIVTKEAAELKRGTITWSSLGAFVPSVLFAAPILNSYLFDTCASFNAHIEQYARLAYYYRPFGWMPHTTLATKLTEKQLSTAFTAAASKFKPFSGTSAAISLAICEPFRDLQVWQLVNDM